MICCDLNTDFVVLKSFALDIGSASVNSKALSFELFEEVDDRNHFLE